MGAIPNGSANHQDRRRTMLVRVCQPLSPFQGYDTQAGFPFCFQSSVSIGRRGRPTVPCGWNRWLLWKLASYPQQCRCWTQAAHPSCHCSCTASKKHLLCSLKGARERAFIAKAPGLSGCIGTGDTYQAALESRLEAIHRQAELRRQPLSPAEFSWSHRTAAEETKHSTIL